MLEQGRGARLRRRRVRVSGAGLAEVVASLAEALGLDVVTRAGDADLIVVETTSPREIERLAQRHGVPLLVISRQRAKVGQNEALERAGATRVLDCESCMLELAASLGELLFDTSLEQRRYARSIGGLDVSFREAHENLDAERRGRVVVLNRSGALIDTSQPLREGASIILNAGVAGRMVEIKARVACELADGFGVEFARDEMACAPALYGQAARDGGSAWQAGLSSPQRRSSSRRVLRPL